jgi:hypothetical protein
MSRRQGPQRACTERRDPEKTSARIRRTVLSGGVRRSGRNCRTPLFRIGLLRRVGIGKSRDGHAGIMDAHDPRIGVEREVEGLGRRYLGNQANIRDSRPVSMAEKFGAGPASGVIAIAGDSAAR